jgi:tRNA 2-thiocytidine biosynthesis protein TtcA
MLAEWERQYPGRTETIFSALRNVEPETLADPEAFDFNFDDQRHQAPR